MNLPERYEHHWSQSIRHPLGRLRLYFRHLRYYQSSWTAPLRRLRRGLKQRLLGSPPAGRSGANWRRTTDVSKREYDAVGSSDHIRYDLNEPMLMDCSGIARKIGLRDVRDHMARVMLKRVEGRPQRILDYGSGNGINLRAFSRAYPEANITGIDISRSRIDYARQWLGPIPNVDMLQMDGSALSFPDNHFDLVYSCHVLEQMESIAEAAISEMLRVAKSRLIMVEPVEENATHVQRLYLRRADYIRSLLSILKSKNVDIVENVRMGVQFNPLCQSTLLVVDKRPAAASRAA